MGDWYRMSEAEMLGIEPHTFEDGRTRTCHCTTDSEPFNACKERNDSTAWYTARADIIKELGKSALGDNTEKYTRDCHYYTDGSDANTLLGIEKQPAYVVATLVIVYIRVLITLYVIKIKQKKAPRTLEKDFKKFAAYAEPFIFDFLKMDKREMFMQPTRASRKRTSSSTVASSSAAPRKCNGRLIEPGQQPYLACQTRVWAGHGDQVLLPVLLSIIEQYDYFIATFCWLSNDKVLDAMRGKALYLRIEDNKDNNPELYKDILVSTEETFICGQHEYDVELLRANPSSGGLSHSHSKMLVAGSMRDGVFIPHVGIVGSYNPTNTTSMDSMVEMYPADHVAHAILQETYIES